MKPIALTSREKRERAAYLQRLVIKVLGLKKTKR